MTTTPATQAPLPVTPEDFKEAARQLGYPPDITRDDIRYWVGGVKLAEVDQRAIDLARHRQAHSLPGDVGMREAADEIASIITPGNFWNARTIGDLTGWCDRLQTRIRALAALTPSPCPGDVGMDSLVSKREYLLLSSYCGGENEADCNDARPCSACLAMCNIFKVADPDPVYLRMLGENAAALTPSALSGGEYAEAFDILVDVQSALVLTAEHSQGATVESFVSSSTQYERLNRFLHERQHADPRSPSALSDLHRLGQEFDAATITPSVEMPFVEGGPLLDDGMCDDHGAFGCKECLAAFAAKHVTPSALSGDALTEILAGAISDERITEIEKIAAYKYFGDYAMSEEQLDATLDAVYALATIRRLRAALPSHQGAGE